MAKTCRISLGYEQLIGVMFWGRGGPFAIKSATNVRVAQGQGGRARTESKHSSEGSWLGLQYHANYLMELSDGTRHNACHAQQCWCLLLLNHPSSNFRFTFSCQVRGRDVMLPSAGDFSGAPRHSWSGPFPGPASIAVGFFPGQSHPRIPGLSSPFPSCCLSHSCL